MKRLLLIGLVVVAAWYGWKHHDELRAHGTHEIVAVNHSGRALERIRIAVAGQAFAIDTLQDGATARLPLRADQDGAFDVQWNVHGVEGDKHWTGGSFTHGPVLIRHRLEFTDGDGVVWLSERIGPKRGPEP